MKQTEKNSSKVNSNVNNETLSVESIKAQLKAACKDMTAKETKDYIKSLDGYSIKKTGEKSKHDTIFYGTLRIGNVFDIQGITADGTARGCISVAKVNFAESMCKVMLSKYDKIKDNLTEDEDIKILTTYQEIEKLYNEIQGIFDTANSRAAERAAKERATKKVGEKIAAGTDSEKIAAIAAALNVSYEVAATIYKEQKKTA